MQPRDLVARACNGNDVNWLQRFLFQDGKIDAEEKKFLEDLKSSAKQTGPEFEAFYKRCMG